jgi:uncharacterized protein DUF2442
VVSLQNATVTDGTLTVELSDGHTISAPWDWYPRLVHGTPEERSNLRLIGNGEGQLLTFLGWRKKLRI